MGYEAVDFAVFTQGSISLLLSLARVGLLIQESSVDMGYREGLM
jgi:hypothetical protein